MFGYVSTDKNELKVCELADYNACYCGLCRSIGARYGQAARATLNYDCTFVAILLCGIKGEREADKKMCVYKPFAKKRVMAADSESFRFAADAEIALAWYKIKDDWNDEKKVLALVGEGGLYSAYRRLQKNAPQLAETVKDGIAKLSVLEKENCSEIDAAANTFAQMLSDLVLFAPIEEEKTITILKRLMFSLGRWIYLIDAWDDIKKDMKSGSYNPFIASGKQNDRENASFLLHSALNKAINAYDLLDLAAHKGVLDNIMYRGCVAKTEKVLGGNDE